MYYFKFKKYLKTIILVFLFKGQVFSSLIISGKILNKNNEPLPGANIIIMNSQVGITSGIDGNMDEINSLEDKVLRGKIKAAVIKAKRNVK